ncbi:tyrosine-type recombinase/integrase [Bifidobacterium aquikefiri]|uniref:tyrosine-type recombinase/integrase n=1 Tax=Bifidobacterium aquikefiri TaxID=1653207 RepID=UPI0039E9DD79
MASVESYDTKAGKRYRVRYRKPDGSSTDKRGFKRKKDATDWAADNVTVAINTGSYTDPTAGRRKVRDIYRSYIDSHRNLWKPSYLHPLEITWRVHIEERFGDRSIASIRRSEMQTFINELAKRRSASVTLRAFGIFKGIFEIATGDNLIARADAIENIKLPHKPTRKENRHYLTPRQLVDLSAHCGRHGTLILVLGFCGLRWGEAAGLHAEDVDVGNLVLHVRRTVTRVGSDYIEGLPKSWEVRDVPVPAKLGPMLSELKSVLQADEPVFTDGDGHSPRPQSVGKRAHGWWAKALEDTGLESMPPHDLRHTAASIAVSAGANVKALQRMLGHKSAAMTLDTYADLFDSDMREVASRVNGLIPGLDLK